MNQVFVEVVIKGNTNALEWVLALMNDESAFDGVEETDAYLKFYFKEELFDEDQLKIITSTTGTVYSLSHINDQNWNSLWEENFEPVTVDDFVYIRADFHAPRPQLAAYEIVITPKMSFGTGHHATTFMMLAAMRSLIVKNKNVIDFGTGTGILAIMAHKLGAKTVTAIDYDSWSIDNARENFSRNNASGILLVQADQFPPAAQTDIILANINRNIIVDNFDRMYSGLQTSGWLVVSGLLKTDQADIVAVATNCGFQLTAELEKNNWICLTFRKN